MTTQQKKANEQFLHNLSKTCKMWLWTDESYLYEIENGDFYTDTLQGVIDLENITTKSFHKRIHLHTIQKMYNFDYTLYRRVVENRQILYWYSYKDNRFNSDFIEIKELDQ